MKIVFKFIILFTLLLNACKNTEIENLRSNLMQAHDTVMPETMRISEIKKKIDAIATKNTNVQLEAAKLNVALQKTEDKMYKWMEELGSANNDIKDKDLKLEKYKTLNNQILEIKTSTSNAINSADNFIKKHNNNE